MERKYQLLVFDWDGTLMDSVQRIVDCFQMTFAQCNLQEPVARDIKQTIGLPLADGVEKLLHNDHLHMIPTLVDRYRDIWLGGTLPLSPLFSGVPAMLKDFANEGYTLAVATGKSRVGLERDMGESGIADLFQHTRCAQETRAKPHPEMLHEIMEAAGVAPEKTLMVGDTTMDLEMANNAGADGVGVTTGGHPEEQLLGANPVACFNDITLLTAHLAAECN